MSIASCVMVDSQNDRAYSAISRRIKFQQQDSYMSVSISVAISWFWLVCLKW